MVKWVLQLVRAVKRSRIQKLLIAMAALSAACCVAAVDGAALERAKARLSQLTLDEKVLLCGGSGTMTLRVPESLFADGQSVREWRFSDNSHTVRSELDRWNWNHVGDEHSQVSTMLPTMCALATTWNRELAALHGEVLGEEARARGVDQILGPGVNIVRSPLCGRNWEYMTEDPCLGASLVVPLVRAIQSRDVVATVKHFALNNQENDRHKIDVIVDERTLNEIYLPIFRAAIVEGGCLGVMSAYNKYNGDWCSENIYLQRAILRDRWHFPGTIVTDWGGAHSTVKAALNGAGIEMNRGDEIRYFTNPKSGRLPLADAVRCGEVPEAVVDEIALHTLYVMECVKFFEPQARAAGSRNTKAHRDAALRIADEAVVLLKNDAGVLPLDKSRIRRILVIGELADVQACRLGWSAEGNPPYEITPLRGIAEYLGSSADVVAAPLVAGDEKVPAVHPVEAAIQTFDESAVDAGMSVRAWKAEYWPGFEIKGEPAARGALPRLDFDDLSCPSNTMLCARFTTRLKPDESGVYRVGLRASQGSGFRLWVDGKRVIDNWDGRRGCEVAEKVRMRSGRVREFVVEYRSGGNGTACHFGWVPPSATAMNFAEVRHEAMYADAVVVVTGTRIGHGRAQESEGEDRPDMKLAPGHDEAIAQILSWNLPRLVIVNRSGSPVEMPWADDAKTILHIPYLGQEAGRALARAMFGDVNPSGHLPWSWPRRYEDTCVARAGVEGDGRTAYGERFYVGYRWFDKTGIAPLFPFGYGLSYTTFSRGEITTKWEEGRLVVSVPVTNTGAVAGADVVKVFASWPNSAVEHPPRELMGFDKVFLQPGETRLATISIKQDAFSFWDEFSNSFAPDGSKCRLVIE